MPLKLDNPASRFHRILERAVGHADTARLTGVWATAFETKGVEKTLEKLGLFYSLPKKIEQQLQRLDDYDPHDMAWWPPFASAISVGGFNRPYAEIKSAFTPDLIGAVRSRARTLSRYFPEPMLEDSEIESLKSLIAEVKNAVENDEGIDAEVSEYILRRLTRIDSILSDINLLGAVGIRDDLETVRRDIAQKAEEVKDTASDSTKDAFSKWNGRVRAILLTLGMAGVSAGELAQGGQAIKGLLQPPTVIENTQSHERPQLELENDLSTPKTQDDVEDAEFKPAADTA